MPREQLAIEHSERENGKDFVSGLNGFLYGLQAHVRSIRSDHSVNVFYFNNLSISVLA